MLSVRVQSDTMLPAASVCQEAGPTHVLVLRYVFNTTYSYKGNLMHSYGRLMISYIFGIICTGYAMQCYELCIIQHGDHFT